MTLIWPTIGSILLVPFWKQDCKNLRKIIHIKHYQCQCNCFNLKLFQYKYSCFNVRCFNVKYEIPETSIKHMLLEMSCRWILSNFCNWTHYEHNRRNNISTGLCHNTLLFFLDIFPFFSVISQVWPNFKVYCKIYSSKLCF